MNTPTKRSFLGLVAAALAVEAGVMTATLHPYSVALQRKQAAP